MNLATCSSPTTSRPYVTSGGRYRRHVPRQDCRAWRRRAVRPPDAPLHTGVAFAVPVPDPVREAQREVHLVQGELPSPSNPPSGCRFRTRCPLAIEQCAGEVPVLRQVGESVVACHRADEPEAMQLLARPRRSPYDADRRPALRLRDPAAGLERARDRHRRGRDDRDELASAGVRGGRLSRGGDRRPDRAKAERLAERFGIPNAYGSATELLADASQVVESRCRRIANPPSPSRRSRPESTSSATNRSP